MTMLMHHMLRAAAGYAAPTPPSTDPQFNYVTMLLHGDGTNGAQNNTFVDSSTNNFTITRNGTPTQGTFSPYGDLWSNYFSGSTQYMTVATNAAFTYGTGDFTIEGWALLGRLGTLQFLVDQRNSLTATAVIPSLYVSVANVLTYYVNGAARITGTTALAEGVWFHFAVCRSGTSTKLFLNGVQEGSTYSDTNNYAASRVVLASQGSSATSFLQGYLSNVRLVKGTALYTSNFTPSTTPLTAISGTSLLACQSNRFRDNSSNNFAFVVFGAPAVQRFSPFDPAAEYSTSVIGGSGFMTGTQYLLLGGQSEFSFDADFTVELWFYALGAGTGTPKLYESRGSGQEGVYVTIEHSGTSLVFRMSSAARITTTFAYNTWNHVALVRSSGVITMYLNGVSAGTYSTSATTLVGTSRPCIGAYPGFDNLNGYVSNLRVVKGTAVYTAAFTPPTAPLTAITNTSLLLNTVNAGIFDNAMMNDLVTVGDAQISTAVVKYGTGSMKFDGTGDYLTATNTLPFVFGTGDWTIETWVNPSVRQLQRIYDSRPTSTNGAYVTIGMNASGNFDYTANSALRITGTTVASTGTWYHVAVCRSGTSTRLFVNGVQEGVTYTDSTNYIVAAGRPFIGADSFSAGATPWNGYMDDFRVTKGYARYTANFTPPTAAFPNN